MLANISIERNIIVPTGDGIQLATDIHRLERSAPKPVLAVRTPNDKDQMVASGDFFDILSSIFFAAPRPSALVLPIIER